MAFDLFTFSSPRPTNHFLHNSSRSHSHVFISGVTQVDNTAVCHECSDHAIPRRQYSIFVLPIPCSYILSVSSSTMCPGPPSKCCRCSI